MTQRHKVENGNPGISLGDVSKAIARMWQKASEVEKAPFEAEAAAEREICAASKVTHQEQEATAGEGSDDDRRYEHIPYNFVIPAVMSAGGTGVKPEVEGV